MYLLYCDESNLEERSGDFLLYGGLLIEPSAARELSAEIDRIRATRSVPRDYRLKFNPGPQEFDHYAFIELKREVLEASARYRARLIVYAILHDIARSPDEARLNGINTVCYHFNCILNRVGGTGLVLIDRFNDAKNAVDAHLRDKFMIGLTGMPFSAELRLDNIVGYHYSALGQSHFASVLDVALGSLRFAINTHTRNQANFFETSSKLLELLSPLFWRDDSAEEISELAFMFSPKSIRIDKYRDQYRRLKDFLVAGGLLVSQEVGGR